MRCIRYLPFALLVATTLTSGPAFANICEAGRMRCATTMPDGGYCQCSSHGVTEDGTVVGKPESRQPLNATAGGCGADPRAPGCR
jgi:hypothetical protein